MQKAIVYAAATSFLPIMQYIWLEGVWATSDHGQTNKRSATWASRLVDSPSSSAVKVNAIAEGHEIHWFGLLANVFTAEIVLLHIWGAAVFQTPQWHVAPHLLYKKKIWIGQKRNSASPHSNPWLEGTLLLFIICGWLVYLYTNPHEPEVDSIAPPSHCVYK